MKGMWWERYGKRTCEYMFHSISTVVKIITVQGMQTQPHVQKLPERSLKQIKWSAMKSSKDVVDKANAPLNTAAGYPNPSRTWWAISEKQAETAFSARRGNFSRLCGPGPASAPVTHLMSSPHPGRVCWSCASLGLSTARGGGGVALCKRGIYVGETP